MAADLSDTTGLAFRITADDMIGVVDEGALITTQWVDSVGSLASAYSTADGGSGDVIFHSDATGNGHAGALFDGDLGGLLYWAYGIGSGVSNAVMIVVATALSGPRTGLSRVVVTSANGSERNIWYWGGASSRPFYFQSGLLGGSFLANNDLQIENAVEIWALAKRGAFNDWYYSVNQGSLGGTPEYKSGSNPQESDTITLTTYKGTNVDLWAGGTDSAGFAFGGYIHEVLFYKNVTKTATEIDAILKELDTYYADEGPTSQNAPARRTAAGVERSPALQLPYPSEYYDRDNQANLRRVLELAINSNNSALSRLDTAIKDGLVLHAPTHGKAGPDAITELGPVTFTGNLTLANLFRLVLPQVDDATAPTICFGDGDSGLYESADDVLTVGLAGSAHSIMEAAWLLRGSTTGHPGLLAEVASATNPTVIPDKDDLDTGVGATTDSVSVIAGGVEAVRFAEVSSHVLMTQETHAGITASSTQTQGQQVLLSSLNIVGTVGTTNDVVTLPGAVEGLLCVVINSGANVLQVFPASGDDLGAGVNNSETIAVGARGSYIGVDTTNWHSA